MLPWLLTLWLGSASAQSSLDDERIEVYSRACDLGLEAACEAVGRLYLKRACDLGDARSCDRLLPDPVPIPRSAPPPRQAGDPIRLGHLSAEQIRKTMNGSMNRIRYCYQREVVRDPKLAGKIHMKFTVEEDGTVSNSRVRPEGALADCIVPVLDALQFPRPDGGIVIVSYPWIICPG